MKKIARALALVTGFTLLAGCDSVTQNWFPLTGADHRPEVKKVQVTGFVEDAVGNELPGAMVSNGASVTFTAEDGSFVLSNVRTGVQSITASYDDAKSSVDIEVRGDKSNTIPRISVGTAAPVTDKVAALKYVQIFPDTLTASYSTTVATASVGGEEVTVTSYGTTTYQAGRDVQLSLAAPPNGAGNVIQSYLVEFSATEVASISADFSPTIRVEPGSPTKSGPLKNLTIKNIGPSSKEFSEWLAKSESGTLEATITLYTASKDLRTTADLLPMHVPVSGNKNKSLPFKATVTIIRAER